MRKQTKTPMHSTKLLLKPYTKAGKISILRNKPAEFPSHATQHFHNHVLLCVNIWPFSASLLNEVETEQHAGIPSHTACMGHAR